MGTTTLMSLAEFERLENGADEIELLKGELIRMPPAQHSHMEICERLFELLKAAVKQLKSANPRAVVGKVHMEMGYFFPNSMSWLQPDVTLTYPDQPIDRYYIGAPLIAFEIVSESDTARRLELKIAEYLAHGSMEVWAIYPETRRAWVYSRSTPSARLETSAIHSDILPGVEIPFGDIL
jgi:Uma2 family endonuclease